MSARGRARAAQAAIWLPVLAYALVVARGFFHTADRAIYLSTDDAVANISYALGTIGRYGFLSSPMLEDMARDHGLFSYGPYYFYLGAALIWLFGYSLTLLRSIHLGVVLAVALASRTWFGPRAGRAAGALCALGLIFAFERGQWPMVRPDSMVSLFAVALLISGGMGIRTMQARYWLLAGVFGACGAFTHLVAWSLVPATVLILAVGFLAASRRPDGGWQRPPSAWPVVWTALGGLAGAALFYASFGFRFADQYAFLTGYQKLTGSMANLDQASLPFGELLLEHFRQAYWFLPYPLAYAVWATMAVAAAVVAVALARGGHALGRQALAWVAPPLVVWVAYLLSLGTFNNFHTGYAMLNQVMWIWTAGALVAVALEAALARPALGPAVGAAAWTAALALGVGLLTVLAPRTDYRALTADSMVPIDAYVDHVLDAIPARARAWGSVVFGIEHPGRVQLVQFREAIDLVQSYTDESRATLAPDYLIWGHQENLNNIIAVLRPPPNPDDLMTSHLASLYPDRSYTLVSMTSGAPYGVTRVYAWGQAAPALESPMVSAYDPGERQWNRATGLARPVTLTPAAAGSLFIEPGGLPSPVRAAQSASGELDPGTYLLRVDLDPGVPRERAAIVLASPDADVRALFGEMGPDIDISPRFGGETAVHLLYRHPGGRFFLHQFGAGPGAVVGLSAARLLPLTDYAPLRRPEPEAHALRASQWEASFPEIVVAANPDGTTTVEGNAVQYGYQAYGPAIPVQPGSRMRLRMPVTTTRGAACVGVLDETRMRWLLAPERPQPEYEFQVDDSRTVMPVLADCSASPADVVPMRVTIGDGTYAVWSDDEELYVDELMREFRKRHP